MGALHFLLVTALALGAAHAQAKGGKQSFGDWTVVRTVDKMTDELRCYLTNRKHQRLIYTTEDQLIVDYTGRGGVKGFRYRVDSNKASEWRINTPRDGFAHLTVYSWRNELPNGKKLVVSGLTVLDQVIEFELSLVGLKEAREKMLKDCGVEDPWAGDTGPPEYPPPT